MRTLRAWLSTDDGEGCGCVPEFDDGRLVFDAGDCDGDGRLETEPACRATAISALGDREVTSVLTHVAGLERAYVGRAGALLVSAGRFVERVRVHDERLAERACRDPLGAAREATGRADAVADVAAETGLAEVAAGATDHETVLEPSETPAVSQWRVDPTVPDAPLAATRDLDTGATVRVYGGDGRHYYHLRPAGQQLDECAVRALAAATDRVTSRTGGVSEPRAAVETVADGVPGEVVERVVAVLEKHTRGYGLLEDLFADPEVSDVFVTAPTGRNPVRVVADDRPMRTNVRLSERGVGALASQFRRESGRSFSRAAPTLDAAVDIGDRSVRVAGLRPPVADGLAFAFRAHDRGTWRLGDLVANGTVTPPAAALLSLAVERGRAVLLAGARGAGKTTALGALLWELPPAVRTVVIEDTPELPTAELQAAGRDVQALRTGEDGGEIPPGDALRTALRLGDGALVVGEVRGEEAPVLYEAMRVGAKSEAVLGTIHGEGAADVYERVVDDLGVAPGAFGATDLVVTLAATADGRRVRRVEEVTAGASDAPGFEALYAADDGTLSTTDRIERGNSRLVADLAAPGESYEDVGAALAERTDRFSGPVPDPPSRRAEGRGSRATDAAFDTRRGVPPWE